MYNFSIKGTTLNKKNYCQKNMKNETIPYYQQGKSIIYKDTTDTDTQFCYY